MHVAELAALGRIEIVERPLPEPGPGEVRVRVHAVGVCGSDVHYYAEGRIGNQIARFPTVMGHEPAGVIDALGPGVDRLPPGHGGPLRVGQRVMIEPAHSCGVCVWCRQGRANVCPHVDFLGTPPNEGIFAEYRNLPADCCIPLPDNLSMTEAALLEPLGVGFHAVKLARLELGESVAVFGCGPIGLAIAMAARLAGARTIFMTDPIPERRRFAARWVGAEVFDGPEADLRDAHAREDHPVAQWIRDRHDGALVDATFEAAGDQATLTQSCLAARIGGRVVMTGIPSVDDLSIPMHIGRRREHTLQHVRRANGEAEAAMALVAAGRLSIKELATHHFPLERTAEAFELVHGKKDGVIRAIIHPHGGE